MDPNATISELIAIALDVQDMCKNNDEDGLAEAADELADLLLTLDAWIVSGGFLPTRWAR